jgi:hypothetical protein
VALGITIHDATPVGKENLYGGVIFFGGEVMPASGLNERFYGGDKELDCSAALEMTRK